MSLLTMHLPSVAQADTTAIAGDHWIEKLTDGSHVLIRPIRASDRERETDLIRHMSPEAKRARFLGEFREPGKALIDQLMNVDGDGSAAFVALVHNDGTLREIGVSRYGACTDPGTCECAVTVDEAWQRRGLGTILMGHLLDSARRHGFRRMVSLDAASNDGMHHFAHRLGFVRVTDPVDATQVIHSIDLGGE